MPDSYEVVVDASGTRLATDVYLPEGVDRAPAILVRTPYGTAFNEPSGRFFASHGYAYVVQDVRGSGRSGAGGSDFFGEAADGRVTADWIAEQPWFDGRLGAAGFSYLGFTAWALASTRPPQLKALSVQLYSSDRTSSWFPGGSFHLEMALPWAITRAANADAVAATQAVVGGALAKGYLHLPLSDADRFAGGTTVAQFQDWLRHPGPGPRWDPIDFSAVSGIPTLLIDGWYDYHMPYLVQDYHRLRASGTPVRLILGPWEHLTMDNNFSDRETLAWFDEHLLGRSGPAPEVRYFVQPSVGWRDASRWPPEPAPLTFHLGTGGRLIETADDDGSDVFIYDPADPTPALGGAAIAPPPVSGRRDQAERESRPDVLTYSSDPLPDDVDVFGSPAAEIHLHSSAVSTDVFVRLCDVDGDGASWNVTDGFLRLRPEGVVTVAIELAPTAYRFVAGHRIRLQISSGAHPVYARNPGTGEALADATTLVAATQQVLHRSTITLPVVTETTAANPAKA